MLAKTFMNAGNSRAFYGELSQAMNSYLGNKFQLPNTDLNSKKIADKMKENRVEDQFIDRYLDILKTCEMAVFAGQSPSGMTDIYEKSVQLISELG